MMKSGAGEENSRRRREEFQFIVVPYVAVIFRAVLVENVSVETTYMLLL